jgi:hypothetical protein
MNFSDTKASIITTARIFILSTLLAVFALAIKPAISHELQPAIANFTISEKSVNATLELSLEPLISGMDLSALENTDDAPEAAQYDTLRALSPEDLQSKFNDIWPDIKSKFQLNSGTNPLDIIIDDIAIPEIGDIELSRTSTLQISANLPDDGSDISFGWNAELGEIIVRQINSDGEVGYAKLLASGSISDPMPRAGMVEVNWLDNFLNYIVIGFEHIIPKGLDHILFVLGLFFFSLKMKPLILQITAFTLAHTVTLAMATLGLVSVPASVVEPLIALSIAFVALENVKGGKIGLRRTAIIFAFGLLHGLGFAYVLGDVGLQPSQFVSSLIAFNIGVEIGQLSVIAIAYIVLGLTFGKKPWYRSYIAIPASVLIAAVGIYWTIERVFF